MPIKFTQYTDRMILFFLHESKTKTKLNNIICLFTSNNCIQHIVKLVIRVDIII